MFPPTILVVHPKERRSKCTVEALRGRDGFVFWKYPRMAEQSLAVYVRLGMGGPLIGPDDAAGGLLVLDGTWRWTAAMERDFDELPVRSLPAVQTAYPRVSNWYDDPEGGLATIEAVFVAYHLMGRDTAGLLDDYHWAEQFRTVNHSLFEA